MTPEEALGWSKDLMKTMTPEEVKAALVSSTRDEIELRRLLLHVHDLIWKALRRDDEPDEHGLLLEEEKK